MHDSTHTETASHIAAIAFSLDGNVPIGSDIYDV